MTEEDPRSNIALFVSAATQLERAVAYPGDENLTGKQLLFVEHYVQLLNATAAAQAAGYSEDGARAAGSRNLRNARVRAQITARIENLVMDRPEILWRLDRIARASPGEFLHSGPDGMPEIDLEAARAAGALDLIKRLNVTAKGGVHIEFYDKLLALEKLARIYGMFKAGHKTEDWLARALELIKKKEITYADLERLVQTELARVKEQLIDELYDDANIVPARSTDAVEAGAGPPEGAGGPDLAADTE